MSLTRSERLSIPKLSHYRDNVTVLDAMRKLLKKEQPCRLCEAGICSKHQPRHIFDVQRVAPSRGEEETK